MEAVASLWSRQRGAGGASISRTELILTPRENGGTCPSHELVGLVAGAIPALV